MNLKETIRIQEALCIDGCFKMKSVALKEGRDVILKMHKEDVGSVLMELLENNETVEIVGIEENVEVGEHETLEKAIVLRVKFVG